MSGNLSRFLLGLALALPLSAFGATHIVQVGQNSGGGAAFAFNPQTLAIPSGDTVTFVNNSGGFHNAVSDDGGTTFSSGAASSAAWSYETPPITADIGYFCTIHGSAGNNMFGSITVSPTPVSLQSFSVD